jgi:methylenetetrahydrofolate dehydrogenase (NADP+)/methenyltetrahydrofolate cyclohydrolase
MPVFFREAIMTARIIDGRALAETIRAEIKKEADQLKAEKSITPGLAVVLVGENPASQVYVRMKKRACEKLGFHSEVHTYPADISQKEVLKKIDELNKDPKIHGILVQLPLPDHIDEQTVLLAIDIAKDVDGFHPINVGKLAQGLEGFVPCTPYGIQEMLIREGTQIEGSHVVVVGRSNIVGKPIAFLLMQKNKRGNATVTVCHSRTKNLPEVTRQADILIAAIGRPEFITADMVKEGATVIDVGVNRVDAPDTEKGYRLAGDVVFDEVKEVAGAITPVPGGVGPMTITMLLHNTLIAAKAIGK